MEPRDDNCECGHTFNEHTMRCGGGVHHDSPCDIDGCDCDDFTLDPNSSTWELGKL